MPHNINSISQDNKISLRTANNRTPNGGLSYFLELPIYYTLQKSLNHQLVPQVLYGYYKRVKTINRNHERWMRNE